FTKRGTVLARQLHGAPWKRIGIAGAAEDEHCLRRWVMFLDVGLRVARIVTTDLVVITPECGVVRAGLEEDGAELAVGGVDARDRHTAVRQAARIDAEPDAIGRELPAVHREMDNTALPRKPRRLQTDGCVH